MIAVALVLAMFLAQSKTEDFWPITGAGWVAFFVSIGTAVVVVIGAIIGYGKWLSKMNGLGRRVAAVENEQVQIRAVQDERGLQFERILTQHEALIAAVSEAKKRAEQCSDEADQHAMLIGSKVSELTHRIGGMELSISQRLTAVETKIDIMRSS